MKRSLVLVSTALGFACAGNAQFFAELHGNYLLPIGGIGSGIGMGFNPAGSFNGATSYLIGFGNGPGGGAVIGYGISEVIGVEARFTYLPGLEQKNFTEWSEFYYYSIADTWKTRYFRIDPAVRFTAPGNKLRMYLAAGPSFAFDPRTDHMQRTSVSANGLSSWYEKKEEYRGGMGYGGFGALGITWSSGGAFGFFAEVQATAMNWAPHTLVSELGSSEFSGDPETIHFVNTVDEEDERTKIHLPMSTWGFRAGVRFVFGGGGGNDGGGS